MVEGTRQQHRIVERGSMKDKYIKIKIDTVPKKYGKTVLTDQEKEARIYELAEKMNVKIGVKKDH